FVRRSHGRLVQSHGGSVRGFVCDVRRHPDDDAFVAVLCNRTDAPFGELANAIEALLFGERLPDPPAPLPAARARELVGAWVADGARLVVEPAGELLRARIEWRDYPPSRGFVTGKDLARAALFDWHEVSPL